MCYGTNRVPLVLVLWHETYPTRKIPVKTIHIHKKQLHEYKSLLNEIKKS